MMDVGFLRNIGALLEETRHERARQRYSNIRSIRTHTTLRQVGWKDRKIGKC
jgi:hypothetical protein